MLEYLYCLECYDGFWQVESAWRLTASGPQKLDVPPHLGLLEELVHGIPPTNSGDSTYLLLPVSPNYDDFLEAGAALKFYLEVSRGA